MKIVFACGGTGGHIFPAFSVAEELEKRFPSIDIFYVCGRKDIENAIFKVIRRRKIVSIESAPLEGVKSLLDPRFLIKLSKGFFRAAGFLRREKPDLVAGFGGYFSFPAVLAARVLGIPTLIHEQNVVPGAANRALARWVDGVALSFDETSRYLGRVRRLAVTGNPIRSSIERDCRREALDAFGFSDDKVTVLVLGGSQGAESINAFFLEALGFLPDALKPRIQVLHLCGRMAPGEAEEACRRQAVASKAFSFFERMDLVYGAADFAIGRAGATFLAEIGFKKIPAILVPYPHGSGHQRVNAAVFGRTAAATVVEQERLSAGTLAALIERHVVQAEQQKKKTAGPDARAAADPANPRVRLADFMIECMHRR